MNKDELKKYLEEELSEKERNALERELADDPFFADSVEGLQNWKSDTGKNINSLEQELEERIDKKSSEQKSFFRMPFFRLILSAACIIGICLFALNYFLHQRDNSEQLFAAYFKPLTHPDATVRGENPSTEKTELQAIKSYETENYKQAIYYYKKLTEEQPNNEKHALFLGIAYLANYQPEQAVEVLNKTYTENVNYENDRTWYLALAYIRLNNMESAKTLLQQLSSSSSYYTEPATALLKALNYED